MALVTPPHANSPTSSDRRPITQLSRAWAPGPAVGHQPSCYHACHAWNSSAKDQFLLVQVRSQGSVLGSRNWPSVAGAKIDRSID